MYSSILRVQFDRTFPKVPIYHLNCLPAVGGGRREGTGELARLLGESCADKKNEGRTGKNCTKIEK